jgi:hypothetical protein
MSKVPPKQHPKPYGSALRLHVKAILFMRRHKHMTWAEIARQLEIDYGIAVHRSTVFRVYKRVRDRRDHFDPGTTPEVDRPAPRKTPITAFALKPSDQSKSKHTIKGGRVGRRISAEELLKPMPRGNTGPFAKWKEQHTQQKKKSE